MKLDRKLNIILPLECEDGKARYAHAMPLDAQVYELHFMELTEAYASMAEKGMRWFATFGPRNAARVLRKVAGDKAAELEASFFAELRRLTMVVGPGPNGWETVPLDQAGEHCGLSKTDISEVENALTFFMLVSLALRPSEARVMNEMLSETLGAEFTSSNSTEYARSLPTSTPAESTGERVVRSHTPR